MTRTGELPATWWHRKTPLTTVIRASSTFYSKTEGCLVLQTKLPRRPERLETSFITVSRSFWPPTSRAENQPPLSNKYTRYNPVWQRAPGISLPRGHPGLTWSGEEPGKRPSRMCVTQWPGGDLCSKIWTLSEIDLVSRFESGRGEVTKCEGFSKADCERRLMWQH